MIAPPVNLLFGLVVALLLAACSSTPTELTVAEEEWVYEVRAINLVMRATSDVNTVSGRPHSIAVGVFQMSDPNTFNGLSVTREGAVELLQKRKIDDTVVDFQLVNLRPGELKKLSINRAETAKFIGIVVGYYQLNPKTDVKIFPIPLREIKRGLVEQALAFTSLVTDEAKAVPGKLNLVVDLGRTGSRQIITVDDETLRQNRVTSGQIVEQQKGWIQNLESVSDVIDD